MIDSYGPIVLVNQNHIVKLHGLN